MLIATNLRAYELSNNMFTLIASCQSVMIFFLLYGMLFFSKEMRRKFLLSLYKKEINVQSITKSSTQPRNGETRVKNQSVV
uniref:7TM GPCR serpentine receptor class x (Srx) domain-containing protein n=1 Tax=Strongyloides venezuelensis TaxID=75913 RepID=A0A0K0G4R2_STRVS